MKIETLKRGSDEKMAMTQKVLQADMARMERDWQSKIDNIRSQLTDTHNKQMSEVWVELNDFDSN